MFPFPFVPNGLARALSYTYDSNQMDGDNLTVYLYGTQTINPLGDWLIVAAAYNSGAAVDATGVTCNGSAMTLIALSATNKMTFWRIAHPGGSTAAIEVTNSGACSRGVLGVWSLTGTPLSWTPVDTFNKGVDTTLDVLAGGVAFGIGYDGSGAVDTWSAGLALDNSAQLGGDGASGSVASAAFAVSQAGKTVTTSSGSAFAISLR